jgi:hypothetical protein
MAIYVAKPILIDGFDCFLLEKKFLPSSYYCFGTPTGDLADPVPGDIIRARKNGKIVDTIVNSQACFFPHFTDGQNEDCKRVYCAYVDHVGRALLLSGGKSKPFVWIQSKRRPAVGDWLAIVTSTSVKISKIEDHQLITQCKTKSGEIIDDHWNLLPFVDLTDDELDCEPEYDRDC